MEGGKNECKLKSSKCNKKEVKIHTGGRLASQREGCLVYRIRDSDFRST